MIIWPLIKIEIMMIKVVMIIAIKIMIIRKENPASPEEKAVK